MRDFVRKPFNLIVTGFIALSIIVLIVVLFGQTKQQLPAYIQESTEATEETVEHLDINYQTVTNESIGYSMLVPADWQVVENGNVVSFIKQADKTTVQIETMDYFGSVNNITEESVSNDITNANGIFYSFAKLNNSAYTCSYECDSCFYAEYTVWDLDRVIRVSCICTSDLVDTYIDTFRYLLDTFQWNGENPIPDGYFMLYNEYGNFEFGVPSGWSTAIDANGLWTAVSETGSTIQCNVIEYSGDLSEITDQNYADVFGISGTDGFELTFFNNQAGVCTAEAIYYIGNTQYCIASNFLTQNGYLYEFYFGCTAENYEDSDYYINALSLFRIF